MWRASRAGVAPGVAARRRRGSWRAPLPPCRPTAIETAIETASTRQRRCDENGLGPAIDSPGDADTTSYTRQWSSRSKNLARRGERLRCRIPSAHTRVEWQCGKADGTISAGHSQSFHDRGGHLGRLDARVVPVLPNGPALAAARHAMFVRRTLRPRRALEDGTRGAAGQTMHACCMASASGLNHKHDRRRISECAASVDTARRTCRGVELVALFGPEQWRAPVMRRAGDSCWGCGAMRRRDCPSTACMANIASQARRCCAHRRGLVFDIQDPCAPPSAPACGHGAGTDPNPIGGVLVDKVRCLDRQQASFIGPVSDPDPAWHEPSASWPACSISEFGIGATLQVVRMQGLAAHAAEPGTCCPGCRRRRSMPTARYGLGLCPAPSAAGRYQPV
ncbi:hypothetical protein FQR65_LT20998 [Abscondita terminalis]|nr:hypothetical protein FQR65_LT20998 [Abscondita terminalis]